ncbi:MAG: hypothetical protein Q8L48_37480 [Archangium sp.]|nr:hypothetical protein [Archangium sp.]
MILPLLIALSAAPNLEAEAKRRTDALIGQGYNFTHGLTFDARPEKTTAKIEFFVPTAEDEHTFSFWAETAQGAFSYRLLASDGKVLSAWSGRKGDATVTLDLPVGKYVMELDRSAGTAGRAILGIKGPALSRCAARAEEHPAAPAKGFHWPYLLYLPKQVKSSRLLVAPNNTGFATDDLELLRTSGSCEVRDQAALADRLGTPLLVPLFPRPPTKEDEDNLYLHALTRSSLETKLEAYRRVDLQLLAMIDDARAGQQLDPAVLLTGFSASGSFVNRFAVLHPERVKAVACGSPGGWPLAPASDLTWPVGVGDVEQLTGRAVDLAALKKVAWFFFLGGDDLNDAVPKRDSFSLADEEVIFRRFGKTPVSRWKAAERLYRTAGLAARFKLYPRVAHQVSPEMEKDLALFFEAHR